MFKNFEQTIIKLAKTYNIPPLEWEDIAQELRIHLYLKEKSVKEPIRNYDNWAYIACKRKIIDLARHYDAKKRGGKGREYKKLKEDLEKEKTI